MSTKKYTVAIRGMLAKVLDKTSTAVYSKPIATAKTSELIKGPATVGFVTGWKITDSGKTWVEILRPEASVLLPVSIIYLLDDDVTFEENPDYNSATDLDRPYDSDKTIIESTGTGSTTPTKTTTASTDYPNGEAGPVVVTKTPTTGGEVIDEAGPDAPTTEDQAKKWLTYGLYGVLGVAVIALTIIIVKSLKKPNLSTK